MAYPGSAPSSGRITSLEARILPLLTTRSEPQLIAACLFVAVLTAGLAGGRFFLEGFGSPVGWILAVGALGFASGPLVLKITKSRPMAGGLVPLVGLVTIGGMAFVENGLHSEGLFWLPLLPVIGAVTQGPGRGIAWMTLGALGIVGAVTDQ